jgi:hypothetical protein
LGSAVGKASRNGAQGVQRIWTRLFRGGNPSLTNPSSKGGMASCGADLAPSLGGFRSLETKQPA